MPNQIINVNILVLACKLGTLALSQDNCLPCSYYIPNDDMPCCMGDCGLLY